MKNKLFQKSSLIAFVVTCLLSLLFTSCNNKKSTESQASGNEGGLGINAAFTEMADLSIVPYDASVVMHLNLKSIWEKGELDNADNVAFIKLLKQKLRDEDPDAAQIVNGLIDNPNSCGLNLKGDIFVFASESMKADVCIGFTTKDSEQFKNFLNNLERSANVSMSYSTESNYNTAFSEDMELGFCWDNKKAYIFPVFVDHWTNNDPRNDVRNCASRLMTFQDSESMNRHDDFKTFIAGRNDLGFFVNTRKIMPLLENSEYSSLIGSLDDFKNTSICFSMSFETGCIKLLGTILGMEGRPNQQFITENFNKDLLNYLPQQTLATVTYSYNIDNYLKLMDDNGMSRDLNEQITDNGYSLRDILKCFTGNIALSLSDIKLGGSYNDDIEPIFTVVGEINNSRPLMQTLDQMESERDLTRVGDTYMTRDGDISIKINDNILMISNDQPSLNAFARGGNGNGSAIVAEKAGKGNYVYLDLSLEDYPAALKRDMDRGVITLIEEYFKDAEMKLSPNYNYELVINLKNTDKNSLKYTIDHIDNNLVTIERLTR